MIRAKFTRPGTGQAPRGCEDWSSPCVFTENRGAGQVGGDRELVASVRDVVQDGEILPAHLTEEAKRRLIANGTYSEDGTVNLETARRLGWDKGWEAVRKK